MKEREPVKKITQQKDKQGPFKYLSQDGSIAHGSKFLPGKAHGISNGKKKGRKYQVGGGTAIPMSVSQGRKGKSLAAGGIYDEQKTKGHRSENIQGQTPGRGRKNRGGRGLGHASMKLNIR